MVVGDPRRVRVRVAIARPSVVSPGVQADSSVALPGLGVVTVQDGPALAQGPPLPATTQRVRPWDPWHREVTSPALWTRRWGKGRIFVATPGHSVDVLQHDSVRTVIERGMVWASR